MKVLNLQCTHQHTFEGWFGSEEDFQSQLSRGLVECPMCADTVIYKMPSAPRLNLGGHSRIEDVPIKSATGAGSAIVSQSGIATSQALGSPSAPANAQLLPADFIDHSPGLQSGGPSTLQQGAFLRALREVVSNTEDMGRQFAEEARRIHYGETEARGIRGQATVREAVELLEEGIEVLPLPMLPALKQTLQ